jgi:hypothetical protein
LYKISCATLLKIKAKLSKREKEIEREKEWDIRSFFEFTNVWDNFVMSLILGGVPRCDRGRGGSKISRHL